MENENEDVINKFVKVFGNAFEKSFEEEHPSLNQGVVFSKPKNSEKKEISLGEQAIASTIANEKIRENQNRRGREELAEESKKSREKGSEHIVL